MRRIVLSFCLIFIITQAFGNTEIPTNKDITTPYEVPELQARKSDLNLEISNYERAIEQAEKDRIEALDKIAVAQEVIQRGALDKEVAVTELAEAEKARMKAENDIIVAESEIKKLESAIAEVEEAIKKEGIITEEADDALKELLANLEKERMNKQDAEGVIATKETDIRSGLDRKKKEEDEAVRQKTVGFWIEDTQHHTGSIPASDPHTGAFTLPISGTITSFSARFHTDTDCSQDGSGCWLCGNSGGQGDGYLNGVHVSYSREGNCGRYISDMGFSNNNINIPIEANKAITFKFNGYAGSIWHSSSYSLYIKVKLADKAAMETAEYKAREAIQREEANIANAGAARKEALEKKTEAEEKVKKLEDDIAKLNIAKLDVMERKKKLEEVKTTKENAKNQEGENKINFGIAKENLIKAIEEKTSTIDKLNYAIAKAEHVKKYESDNIGKREAEIEKLKAKSEVLKKELEAAKDVLGKLNNDRNKKDEL